MVVCLGSVDVAKHVYNCFMICFTVLEVVSCTVDFWWFSDFWLGVSSLVLLTMTPIFLIIYGPRIVVPRCFLSAQMENQLWFLYL